MKENGDEMALEDALTYIKWHFTEPGGLLTHIEVGGEVDQTLVQTIGTAFQIMQSAWKEEEYVPKYAVQLVHHVTDAIPRLEQCIHLYPHREPEIANFLLQVSEWTEMVFSSTALSEEGAIMFVCQHLLGTPAFNTELILGSINESALSELLDALDTLARLWQSREQVSKLAAYAMISASWLFDRVEKLFSGAKEHRLHEIERQVNEHITRCLS